MSEYLLALCQDIAPRRGKLIRLKMELSEGRPKGVVQLDEIYVPPTRASHCFAFCGRCLRFGEGVLPIVEGVRILAQAYHILRRYYILCEGILRFC